MSDAGVFYVQTKDVTIEVAAQESSSINIAAQAVVGLSVPANTEGATLALEGSDDNSTFLPIRRADGTAETVTITAAGGEFWLDPLITMGVTYFRVVSSLVQAGATAIIGIKVRRFN